MEHKALENWSIQDTWNDLNTPDFPIKPRDYIRASEIGSPYLDRYLRMKGVQPTNPFSARTKRILDCGNIFEEVVERMFRLLGILVAAQQTVKVEEKGLLPVIGHYDHKVGGKVQVDKVKKFMDTKLFADMIAKVRIIDPDIAEYLDFMYPSKWLMDRALAMAEKLAADYPDGMKILISECKSVNSRSFWGHKNIDPQTGFFKGYDHHKLQIYTYLKGSPEEEGRRFYISKDDLTLMEAPVHKNSIILKNLWEEDIVTMTKYYNGNKEPDAEPDLVWSEEKQMYDYNWRISRSSYLTYITSFRDAEAWEYAHRDDLKKKNTKKCKNCKKPFLLITLNKYNGNCGTCHKKKGGEAK